MAGMYLRKLSQDHFTAALRIDSSASSFDKESDIQQ